jgi:hypothetical protein
MSQYHRRQLDDREVHRRWIDPRLYSVRVKDLRAYLLGKGWKEVPPDRPGVLVFQEPEAVEGDPFTRGCRTRTSVGSIARPSMNWWRRYRSWRIATREKC